MLVFMEVTVTLHVPKAVKTTRVTYKTEHAFHVSLDGLESIVMQVRWLVLFFYDFKCCDLFMIHIFNSVICNHFIKALVWTLVYRCYVWQSVEKDSMVSTAVNSVSDFVETVSPVITWLVIVTKGVMQVWQDFFVIKVHLVHKLVIPLVSYFLDKLIIAITS